MNEAAFADSAPFILYTMIAGMAFYGQCHTLSGTFLDLISRHRRILRALRPFPVGARHSSKRETRQLLAPGCSCSGLHLHYHLRLLTDLHRWERPALSCWVRAGLRRPFHGSERPGFAVLSGDGDAWVQHDHCGCCSCESRVMCRGFLSRRTTLDLSDMGCLEQALASCRFQHCRIHRVSWFAQCHACGCALRLTLRPAIFGRTMYMLVLAIQNPLDPSIFDAENNWHVSLLSTTLVQTISATALISYRLWMVDRRAAQFKSSSFRPIIRVMVEAGGLYVVTVMMYLIVSATPAFQDKMLGFGQIVRGSLLRRVRSSSDHQFLRFPPYL